MIIIFFLNYSSNLTEASLFQEHSPTGMSVVLFFVVYMNHISLSLGCYAMACLLALDSTVISPLLCFVFASRESTVCLTTPRSCCLIFCSYLYLAYHSLSSYVDTLCTLAVHHQRQPWLS